MENKYLIRTGAAIRLLFSGLFLFTAFAGKAQQCAASYVQQSPGGGVFNFASTSTGATANTYYYWTFGDGSTGWGSTISHTYTGTGLTIACLQMIDSTTNCWNTYCDTIIINSNPTNPTPTCNPQMVFSLGKDTTQALTWYAYPNYPSGTFNASWNWGDGNSSTGMWPTHTYSAAGVYTICATASVACSTPMGTVVVTAMYCYNATIFRPSQSSAMVNINVVPAKVTGINKLANEKEMLNIYPNPSNGVFTMEINDPAKNQEKINVLVYNMLGEKVLDKYISTGIKENIDLGNLDNGTYFVKSISATGYAVKKISIQK